MIIMLTAILQNGKNRGMCRESDYVAESQLRISTALRLRRFERNLEVRSVEVPFFTLPNREEGPISAKDQQNRLAVQEWRG